jgi:hypothetical protein
LDTLGSHLREEGTLGYDGGLVRLRVQTKFDATINHQQRHQGPFHKGKEVKMILKHMEIGNYEQFKFFHT